MNITGILYTILQADSDVTNICSTRIFPLTIPQQEKRPSVRLSVVAVEPYDTKSGASTLDAVRAQVDSYASTYKSAQQLHEAIRVAIDRYRGTVTVTGDAAYFVDGIRFETSNDIMEEERDIFRVSSDYQIRIHRTP